MAVCACSMGMLKLLPPLSTTATVSATLSSQVGDQLFFPSHPFFLEGWMVQNMPVLETAHILN